MYKSKTKEGTGGHVLKLNTPKEITEKHQVLLNGAAMEIGEIRVKIGLHPAKRVKKGHSGMEEID